jgi:hypothetical protein
MDIATIDNQYARLQQQGQSTVASLQTLGNKLQAASQAGDAQAREWLLDLRELALNFRAEQDGMAALLEALHGYVANAAQQAAPAPGAGWGQPAGGFAAAAPQPQAPPQGGGMFGGFLNSGFGRAIEMGAGFGIGDELIKDIF